MRTFMVGCRAVSVLKRWIYTAVLWLPALSFRYCSLTLQVLPPGPGLIYFLFITPLWSSISTLTSLESKFHHFNSSLSPWHSLIKIPTLETFSSIFSKESWALSGKTLQQCLLLPQISMAPLVTMPPRSPAIFVFLCSRYFILSPPSSNLWSQQLLLLSLWWKDPFQFHKIHRNNW